MNKKTNNFYKNKKVYIAGGAGFIGSHLTSQLIKHGATVTVGDNLSSGTIDNLKRIFRENNLKFKFRKNGFTSQDKHRFTNIDFQNFTQTLKSLDGNEILFHLATNVGGRGYILEHPGDCCEGFATNQNLIKAATLTNIDRVLYASSACVYPVDLQNKYNSKSLLKESDAFDNNWANADESYGWAKLMGEKILESYHLQYGLKGVSTRYVTAYGPWENETHSIIALIKRAVNKEDPYVIWGSGNQDRDFTYVEDIVSGSLISCHKITDASAVNLGTGKRYKIKDVVNMIFSILDWKPKKVVYDKNKPEGVKTRALNNKKANNLGWSPKHDLMKGLDKTINWYLKHK